MTGHPNILTWSPECDHQGQWEFPEEDSRACQEERRALQDGGTSGKQEKKTSNRKCKRRQTQSDESKTKIKTYDNHGFVSKTNSSEKGETTTTLCNPTAEVSTFCEKTSPNRWTDHRRTTDWWSSYLQWSTRWSALWWRSQSYSVIGGKCPACHTSDRDHQLATSLDHNIAWNPPQGGSRSNKAISCSTISMILNLSCTLWFFLQIIIERVSAMFPKRRRLTQSTKIRFSSTLPSTRAPTTSKYVTGLHFMSTILYTDCIAQCTACCTEWCNAQWCTGAVMRYSHQFNTVSSATRHTMLLHHWWSFDHWIQFLPKKLHIQPIFRLWSGTIHMPTTYL